MISLRPTKHHWQPETSHTLRLKEKKNGCSWFWMFIIFSYYYWTLQNQISDLLYALSLVLKWFWYFCQSIVWPGLLQYFSLVNYIYVLVTLGEVYIKPDVGVLWILWFNLWGLDAIRELEPANDFLAGEIIRQWHSMREISCCLWIHQNT